MPKAYPMQAALVSSFEPRAAAWAALPAAHFGILLAPKSTEVPRFDFLA